MSIHIDIYINVWLSVRERQTDRETETDQQTAGVRGRKDPVWLQLVRGEVICLPFHDKLNLNSLGIKRISHMWTLGIQFTLSSTFSLIVSFELEGKAVRFPSSQIIEREN